MKKIPTFEKWLKENEPDVYNHFKPRYDFEVACMQFGNAIKDAFEPFTKAMEKVVDNLDKVFKNK